MSAFLVTGNPGSGETTLARELSRRGYVAVDSDALAGWETESGEEVTEPADATDAWRLAHRWVWRPGLVREVIRTHAAAGRDVFPLRHRAQPTRSSRSLRRRLPARP